MLIPASPLQWPDGWKRTPPYLRTHATFGTKAPSFGSYQAKKPLTIADGTQRVLAELQRMGVRQENLVITSNLQLRQDGLPRSGQPAPKDPGVAVYWLERKGDTPKCMAIDRYTKVEDNLGAVAATLDAMRAIERHGGAAILDRAFIGFLALPGPAPIDWRRVLSLRPGFSGPHNELYASYVVARRNAHPDKGGSAEAFNDVELAYAAACEELNYAP